MCSGQKKCSKNFDGLKNVSKKLGGAKFDHTKSNLLANITFNSAQYMLLILLNALPATIIL